MVYIINGEIVADSDPRARANANRPSGPSGATNRFSGSSRTMGDAAAPTAASSSPTTGASTASNVVLTVPDTLRKVEALLGIEGKKVKIPSFFGRSSVDLPLLYLLLVGIILYMGGLRAVLPILALGYFVATARN